MIEELAPGIYTADHSVAEGKFGAVIGDRVVLVVDTGNSIPEGQALADFLRARRKSPDWLALTHGHGDHTNGAAAFAGSLIFAHDLATSTMERDAGQRASMATEREPQRRAGGTGNSPQHLLAALPRPVVTFGTTLRLDLGGRHVQLFHTPGHSPDSTCAFVEEDAVLFGGDTAVTGIVPAFGDGNSCTLETTLRRLTELPIEYLVGGHGPVLRGETTVQDWLFWLADYLAGVRDYVTRGLAAGLAPEQIVAGADFGRFVAGHLPSDTHGMLRRHENTVRQLLREAEWWGMA